MAMLVTSAEYQRNPGKYNDLALREPVTITKHGREQLVVLSADMFKQWQKNQQRHYYTHELPQDIIDQIVNAEIPQECYDLNYLMEDDAE
jgi:prevent-host-death family protein